jgi:cysteine dioxygenase
MYNLKKLVDELKERFKENKTLINMKDLLKNYNGDEWKNKILESKKSYGKSLIIRNENFDIYVICWLPNQKSLVHDHPKNGCLLKLLEGELIEEIYKKNEKKLLKIKEIKIKEGDISYQEGENGLHKIINKSEKRSISLHIYSPPKSKLKFYKN